MQLKLVKIDGVLIGDNELSKQYIAELGEDSTIIVGLDSEFNLWDIPDHKLPHILWKKSEERAQAEKVYQEYDLNRKSLLAALTDKYLPGNTQGAAERKAQTAKEFEDFKKEMATAKYELMIARGKVEAIHAEIDMRKKRSYDDNREYKAGNMS